MKWNRAWPCDNKRNRCSHQQACPKRQRLDTIQHAILAFVAFWTKIVSWTTTYLKYWKLVIMKKLPGWLLEWQETPRKLKRTPEVVFPQMEWCRQKRFYLSRTSLLLSVIHWGRLHRRRLINSTLHKLRGFQAASKDDLEWKLKFFTFLLLFPNVKKHHILKCQLPDTQVFYLNRWRNKKDKSSLIQHVLLPAARGQSRHWRCGSSVLQSEP